LNLDEYLRSRASHDMALVTHAIARASVTVWEGIPFRSGLVQSSNASGDAQKAIDVFANDEFAVSLSSTRATREVVSEEMEKPVRGEGRVSVAMDPLDGSSNVESNNPLGSIFGFYRDPLPASGESLMGSAFVTYGSMLTLTVSFGKQVDRLVCVRNGADSEFQLLNEGVVLPERPEVFGIGGRKSEWIPPVRKFAESLEDRGMRLRYCGTFVGDCNQVLAKGGIFAYPALVNKPKGKLRLLYETVPMSYIIERAGGLSSDGHQSLLKRNPESLHDTSPAYIGNASLVRELERAVEES